MHHKARGVEDRSHDVKSAQLGDLLNPQHAVDIVTKSLADGDMTQVNDVLRTLSSRGLTGDFQSLGSLGKVLGHLGKNGHSQHACKILNFLTQNSQDADVLKMVNMIRKHALGQPPAKPKADNNSPNLERAVDIINNVRDGDLSEFSKLPYLCQRDLSSDYCESRTQYQWKQIPGRVLQIAMPQSLLIANRVWAVIFRYIPEESRTFLKFSKKNNTLGRDASIDQIIKNAHLTWSEYKTEFHKNRKVGVKKIREFGPIPIEGEKQSVIEWTTRIKNLVLKNEVQKAAQLMSALYRYDTRNAKAISNMLLDIAGVCSNIRFNEISSTLYESLMEQDQHRDIVFVFISTSSSLFHSNKEDLAIQIMENIYRSNSVANNSVIRHLSEMLFIRNRALEALNLWRELDEKSAKTCATLVPYLLKHKERESASILCKRIASVAPALCILYAQAYLISDYLLEDVASFIDPLLNGLDQQTDSLSQVQKHALRLKFRHGNTEERKSILSQIRQLTRKGILAKKDEVVISSTPPYKGPTSFDTEIEEFGESKVGKWKTSKFFQELTARKPHLSPGKKTSQEANSVLFHPKRTVYPRNYNQKYTTDNQ